MSINDEWVRYLRAEGYLGSISDMLRTALQAEAASSYKNLNDLWVAYLNAEGYTGQINDMMYQWLGDKGYTGNLNDRLLAALKADDIFAADAIACVITLTTAYAASFGLQPATISGQTFSIVGGSNGVGYLASTDVAVPTPAWTGRRLVELGSFSNNGAANIRGGIVLPDGSKGIFFEMLSTGQLEFSLEGPIGTPVDVTSIDEAASSVYAVGIDMPSGDVYIYTDGLAAGGIGSYAGFFAGATGFSLLGLIESATSGDASMTFVTDTSNFQAEYLNGELDWCGNALSVWTPDSLFASGENGDWFDFREVTGLWVDDTATETPVASDGDVVGAAVGRRGVFTLTQATTTSKPIWKTTEIQAESTTQKTLTAAFTPVFPSTGSHGIYVAGRLVASNSTTANGPLARLLNNTTVTSQVIMRRSAGSHTIFGSSFTDTTVDKGLVDMFGYSSAVRPGTTGYTHSTHGTRTARTFVGAAAVELNNAAITCSRATGNYGAVKGTVFINRDLSAIEVAKLNLYYGGIV